MEDIPTDRRIAMPKRKAKCRKCKKEIDNDAVICHNCGAIIPTKRGMMKKEDLKKLKEI